MRAAIALFSALTCAVVQSAADAPALSSAPTRRPPTVAATSFNISDTLGDHMVLQRSPQSAVVWGWAAPRATVIVTLSGSAPLAPVAPGADGVWRALLPPTVAGGPYNISFEASTGETTTITDVLFGDLYLCSGQR